MLRDDDVMTLFYIHLENKIYYLKSWQVKEMSGMHQLKNAFNVAWCPGVENRRNTNMQTNKEMDFFYSIMKTSDSRERKIIYLSIYSLVLIFVQQVE